MKLLKTVGMIVAVVAGTGSSIAQTPEAAPKPKEKKICRSLTPTGSFLPTRVCNTEAGWRAFDSSNQNGVTDFRRALNMTSSNERSVPDR